MGKFKGGGGRNCIWLDGPRSCTNLDYLLLTTSPYSITHERSLGVLNSLMCIQLPCVY